MKKTAFLVSWKLCVTLLVFGLCVSVNLCAAEGPTLKDLIEDTSAAETAEGSLKEESSAPATVAPDSPQPVIPADDMKRGTPRSTLLEFQKVAEKGDYERAAEYLDLRYLPYGMTPEQGPELARQLKIVLDRALWVDPELLSTKPEGHSNDGLNSFLDSFGTVEIRDRKVKLLLQRVPRDDGVLIWKISTVTVHQIPELHQEYGYGRIGEYLSKMLPKGQFLSLQLWQWIMALGILAVAYCVVYIPTRIIATLVRRRKTELSVNIARFVAGPLRFLITFLIGLANVELIHPTMKARAIMKGYTAITIIGVWACIILVGILRDVCVIKMKQKGSETAAILLRPITRVVQILVVVIGMMIWFENLGFKAATLLAGLGIGGLAVALAAQKSIENIIGAITLFVSAPVKIGDFGRYGDVLGTVEEIGLRYTDIRTLGRTLVHIPNAVFADMMLENFTDREKIWFHPKIALSRKTSPDQIRYILVEIRKMLYSHPVVDPVPARVRLKEFGSSSLDIEIYAYILRTDYSGYLEVAEDLNLRILDIISQAGTELAVPVQNVWLEKTPPPEKELADAAEKQTRQWREKNEMCLPKFPKEKIDQLHNTLDYPPEGSATKEDK